MRILGNAIALSLASVPSGPPIPAPPPATEAPPPPTDKVEMDAGSRLAEATLAAAAKFKPKKNEFFCYRYVKMGIQSALGLALSGVHAYQAAAQLAHSRCFKEFGKPTSVLKPEDLTRGAVVVWAPNKRHPSGHIFVALGNGQEVSDRIRITNLSYGTSARIFVPSNQCVQ
ncbi:hypothetical protein JST97_11970 [bacterium]|nr:hypothetical protein [bacterium]